VGHAAVLRGLEPRWWVVAGVGEEMAWMSADSVRVSWAIEVSPMNKCAPGKGNFVQRGRVGVSCDPRSQNRDLGHPQIVAACFPTHPIRQRMDGAPADRGWARSLGCGDPADYFLDSLPTM
jgi:hypothetical protein